MKKHLLSLFAMASMVFASSCTSEEIVSQSTGNEVKVTFTTELRNDVKSRAVGDDTEGIDELVFAVYDENHELLPSLTQKVSTNQITLSGVNNEGQRTATINVVLVKGQTYSFTFWAQDKDYTAYRFNERTATVSIEYGQTANNKNADAFFAKINDYTVTGSFEQKVTLKRPFAQVNFLTTDDDLNKAEAAGFEPDQSSIIVQNAATSLNVLTGEVSGDMEAKFELADWIQSETTTIKDANGAEIKFRDSQNATTFKYLATAYFLPTSDVNDVEITASMSAIQSDKSSKAPVELTAPKVKAKRNYRTNIYGNLLTSNGTFYVTVDPGFDGDYSDELEDPTTIVVATVAEANALFANGETNVTIQEAPTTEEAINLPDTEEKVTIYFAFDENAAPEPITIEYPANPTKKPENIEVNGDAGDLIIDAPESTVTLNGNYESVVSTTANNTLVVTKGTKIKNLAVKQGNVRIEDGAEVTNIVRKDNEDTITYVIYEGTLPTEANEDELIVYISASEFKLIDVAANGGEVRLTTNVELTRPLIIAATADATIDLNGCTISQAMECTASYSMITNNGKLTILDSSANGTGKISFKDTSAGDPTFGWGSYTISNYDGELVVENGTIEHLGEQNPGNGTPNKHMYCAIFQYSGSTTINGGTISTPTYRSARLWNGDMTIKGGTFDGQLWLQAVSNTSDLTINGGTFKPNGNDGSSVFVSNASYEVKFAVTGGTFKTQIGCSDATKLADAITGGTFTKEAKENTNSSLIAVGYDFEEQNDGTWAVVKGIEAMIGEQGYKTLQAALDAVKEGETIILQSDVKVTEPAYGQNALNYAKAASFTLDLNGKSIYADTGNSVFRFNITATEATSNVTVTLKNGTITSGDNTWCTVMAAGLSESAKAKFNLENLTVNASKAGDFAVKSWSYAVVTANNVKVNATKCAGGFYAVGGEIVLANCTVNQEGLHTAPYMSMAVAVSNGGKLTVESGNYTTEPTAASEGYNQGTSHGSWCAGVMNSGGELIINGGTFANGNFGDDALATAARGLIFGDTASYIEINEGTFNALKSIIDYQNNLGVQPNPNIVINGGNFSANPAVVTSYGGVEFAEGKAPVQGANGRWILMDAVMDEAGLKAAFAKGGDILLGADITVSETLALAEGNTVVLDLNGKTLAAPDKNTIKNDGGNLTIKNGTVTRTGDVVGYSVNNASGEITVENATIKRGLYTSGSKMTATQANISHEQSSRHAIYAWNCEVTINSGTYHNDNAGNATLMASGSSVVTINGGTFSIADGRSTLGWTSCMIDQNGTAQVIVKGGLFNGGFRINSADTKLTIEGGEFNTNNGSGFTDYSGTKVVKGGKFTDKGAQNWAKKYIAEGYEMNADGEVVAK